MKRMLAKYSLIIRTYTQRQNHPPVPVMQQRN